MRPEIFSFRRQLLEGKRRCRGLPWNRCMAAGNLRWESAHEPTAFFDSGRYTGKRSQTGREARCSRTGGAGAGEFVCSCCRIEFLGEFAPDDGNKPTFRVPNGTNALCIGFGCEYRLCCAVSMTAFGLGRAAVKKTCLFLLLSMALGGIAQNLGRRDLPGLLLGAGLVWLLCVFSFSGAAADREFIPVTLSYRGNTVKLKALRDTGNRLCDPITGEQVLIVSGAVGQKLTGLTPNQLHEPLRTLSQKKLPGLRLIPYRTVGQRSGMLLGVRMNGVMIGKKERNMVVAFDPDGLQADGEVQALLGGNVW